MSAKLSPVGARRRRPYNVALRPAAVPAKARPEAAVSAVVPDSSDSQARNSRSIFDARWQRWSHHNANFREDRTISFLFKPHAFIIMGVVLGGLIMQAFTSDNDFEANTKKGLMWVVGLAVVIMTCNFSDGPFFRPHPAFWRLILAVSVVYELGLVFLLFQRPRDGRLLFRFYDDKLGPPLQSESYAERCELYNSTAPEGPFAHLYSTVFDIFVIGHLFGWWVKAMIYRNYLVCWIMSINFELLEMTFAFQLPNFNECWWDSWILDVLVCNGLGIYLGMKTCEWLEMRTYSFESIWLIPTLTGKMKRLANQMTPMSWTNFKWQQTQSLGSWLGLLFILLASVAVELNAFWLKHVLYIHSTSNLNLYRLYILSGVCAVAIREIYQYVTDKDCKRFGQQSWMLCVIIFTELLVITKYGMCMEPECTPLPTDMPVHFVVLWLLVFLALMASTVWRFGAELKAKCWDFLAIWAFWL